jgi:hypothetical protein
MRKKLVHWAVFIAVLLHVAAWVLMDQSFLPGALP